MATQQPNTPPASDQPVAPAEHTEDRPLVTFILLAYNQERFIREAVEGAFSQTYSPLEILLSDDCSTDRTFEIMQEMAAQYKGPHKIILRQNENNLGIGGHFQKAADASSGEVIIIAAGDDISLSSRSSVLVDYITTTKTVSGVFSNAYIFSQYITTETTMLIKKCEIENEHNYNITINGFDRANLIIRQKGNFPDFINNWCYGATLAIRREVVTSFDEINRRIVNEDNVLVLRSTLLRGFHFVNVPLVYYRRHSEAAGCKIRRAYKDHARLTEIDKQAVKDIVCAFKNKYVDNATKCATLLAITARAYDRCRKYYGRKYNKIKANLFAYKACKHFIVYKSLLWLLMIKMIAGKIRYRAKPSKKYIINKFPNKIVCTLRRLIHRVVGIYNYNICENISRLAPFENYNIRLINPASSCTYEMPDKILNNIYAQKIFMAVKSVAIPPQYLVEIPNVKILGDNGVMYTEKGALLVQGQPLVSFMISHPIVKQEWPIWENVNVDGEAFAFMNYWYYNYHHWVWNECAKYVSVKDHIPADAIIIVPEDIKRWHRDSLIALGIKEQNIVYQGKYESTTVKKLWFATPPGIIELSVLNPHIAIKMKNIIFDYMGIEERPSRKIYISRNNAISRKIINENEIEEILNKYDYEIIQCENLTFCEQVQLFSQAQVVVGVHGAGLTNMLWARSGCKIIEIMNDNAPHLCYWQNAQTLQHKYDIIFGRGNGNNINDDIWIDKRLFEKIISE